MIITAEDGETGVASIEYLLSETAISESDIESQTGWQTYTEFSLEDDGKYIIYAKITDHTGNVTYLSSDGLVIDKIIPVIRGLEDGKTYCGEVTFTADDEYIDYVTVNGETVTEYTLKADGTTYTVKSYDKAGNESLTYTVTVNDGHTFTTYVSNNNATCTDDGTETAKCDYCEATDTRIDEGSATGHDWSEPEWSWSEDGKNCEVIFICQNNSSHIEHPEVTVTSEVTIPATCTADGTTTYTASVTLNGQQYSDTKEVTDIAATGHNWASRFGAGRTTIPLQRQYSPAEMMIPIRRS